MRKVAEEAEQVAELIDKVYRFKINEDKREIWRDKAGNAEYITHSGYWQARYLHQCYDTEVDTNSIFELYKAGWLIDNGYDEEYNENGEITENGERKQILLYFRVFVKRTEGLLKDSTSK